MVTNRNGQKGRAGAAWVSRMANKAAAKLWKPKVPGRRRWGLGQMGREGWGVGVWGAGAGVGATGEMTCSHLLKDRDGPFGVVPRVPAVEHIEFASVYICG